mmetsp:Transcript_70705/g.165817  ORF Transcript_70705/g.165817 Transcript_70705/m.165817 type:complete len:576 (-) Transcript_70705:225-1952(-)
METFSRHLDGLLSKLREDIVTQHEHHMTVQKLRMRAQHGSPDLNFNRPPDTPQQLRPQTWGSWEPKKAAQSSPLQASQPASTVQGEDDSEDEVESLADPGPAIPLPSMLAVAKTDSPENIFKGGHAPREAFATIFAKPNLPELASKEETPIMQVEAASTAVPSPSALNTLVGSSSEITVKNGMLVVKQSSFQEFRHGSECSKGSKGSRPSKLSKMSKRSTSSLGSLPSFFKAHPAGTSQWKQFLQDGDSSLSAGRFARVWNAFILATVFFSLTQALNPPIVSGTHFGYAEVVIESVFCIELLAHALLEPRKMALLRDPHSFIDAVAVLPMGLRIEAGFVLPPAGVKPFSHYVLVGIVPTLRLLKLMRRFGKLSLVTHVLSTTGDALKLLLFLISVIVLSFSTLMYIVEPVENVDSLSTAMWICTVTVTTVGYGDVTPVTNSGRILAAVLCFLSVLFMAMPISVLGNAMTHAWADRSRILLMTRTRQRLKSYGYEASDMPSLFRKFDSNGNGELTMDEFCDMISKMNVGIRASEAEELFELFDTDGSGGIDDREFMKALFPDDYRKLYIRSVTASF